MARHESKSSINWGGLTKGLLAGGAVIGGLALIAPETMSGIAESIGNLGADENADKIKEAGEAAYKASIDIADNDGVVTSAEILSAETARKAAEETAKAGAEASKGALGAINDGASDAASWIGGRVGGMITSVAMKLGGIALAIFGVTKLVSGSSDRDNAAEHGQFHAEQKESFALREDIRKAQAVMMARMQAAGHEPAMAMAQQRG